MSHNSGMRLFASGDYLLDEHQNYFSSAIERLQTYMKSLKEKLHQEKVMLSELKAETRYLTMERDNSAIPEEYLPTNYPRFAQSNDHYDVPRPSHNVEYAGNVGMSRQIEEPSRNLERFDYLNKLKELDYLCKEEMARVNSVVERMEPLKQMASDWKLEKKLNKLCLEPFMTKEMIRGQGGDTVQQYNSLSGNEPITFSRCVNTELVVLPSGQDRRSHPVTTVIAADKASSEVRSKFQDDDYDLGTDLKEEFESLSISKSTPELRFDSTLEQMSELMSKPDSKLEDLPIFEQDEKLLMASREFMSPSASEESLSYQQIMNDRSSQSDDEVKENENSEEDGQSMSSVLSAKSVISLESIKRAFASYNRSEGDSSGSISGPKQQKKPKAIGKTSNHQRYLDKSKKTNIKLMDILFDPRGKRVVNSWGPLDKEDIEKAVFECIGEESKETEGSEASSEVDLNKYFYDKGGYKPPFEGNDECKKIEDSEPLCEDDIINKYLYGEEGYVYTPLFADNSRRKGGNN